jgi:hypothetical protein
MRWGLAVMLLLSCGGNDLKGNGEACSASSECDVGLVCDLGRDPHVCAGMGTPPPPPGVDAPDIVDAGTDATIDAPPDAAQPDAAIDAAIDAM